MNGSEIVRGSSPAVDRKMPQCPERSQEYREVQRRTLSNVRTQSEYHNVSTDLEVVVIGSEVKLRITAMCACGWSDTKTLPEADDE